jgi:hypothetical protein
MSVSDFAIVEPQICDSRLSHCVEVMADACGHGVGRWHYVDSFHEVHMPRKTIDDFEQRIRGVKDAALATTLAHGIVRSGKAAIKKRVLVTRLRRDGHSAGDVRIALYELVDDGELSENAMSYFLTVETPDDVADTPNEVAVHPIKNEQPQPAPVPTANAERVAACKGGILALIKSANRTRRKQGSLGRARLIRLMQREGFDVSTIEAALLPLQANGEVEISRTSVRAPLSKLRHRDGDEPTPCVKSIIEFFDASGEMMPGVNRHALKEYLISKHPASTVDRTLNGLAKSGHLSGRGGDYVFLLNRDVPRRGALSSANLKDGNKPSRFCASSKDANAAQTAADLVRTYYADRLDELFEQPNSYLRRVLRAVELAGRIATAAMASDGNGLRDALETLKTEWIDSEDNENRHPLRAERLLEALQVGLFAESFSDDSEFAKDCEARKQEIIREFESMDREAADAEREIAAIKDRNVGKNKWEKETIPPELVAAARRSTTYRCEAEHIATSGLVPTSGGSRIGSHRLKLFLRTVGVPTDLDDDDAMTAPTTPTAPTTHISAQMNTTLIGVLDHIAVC